MTTIRDIQSIIESMTPEQIKAVLETTTKSNRITVDSRHKAKRIAKTELYFKCAPLPYRSPYEEYKDHSESIRQQVLSGVEL